MPSQSTFYSRRTGAASSPTNVDPDERLRPDDLRAMAGDAALTVLLRRKASANVELSHAERQALWSRSESAIAFANGNHKL